MLIAAIALGIVLSGMLAGDRFGPDRIIWGAWLSASIAGPLILMGQRFRGRRAALSMGEWFWIAPIAMLLLWTPWAFLAVAAHLPVILVVTPACLIIQAICSLIALVWCFAALTGIWGQIRFRWTDSWGYLVSAATGIFAAFLLISAMM